MSKEVRHKNRRIAALLAIFLGIFGVHKFYIGKKKAGFIHIAALFIAAFLSDAIGILLPMVVLCIFTCVEAIIYVLKSDEQFNAQYVSGKRAFL